MSVKLQPTELQSCKSEITADFIVLDFDLFDISVLFSVLHDIHSCRVVDTSKKWQPFSEKESLVKLDRPFYRM